MNSPARGAPMQPRSARDHRDHRDHRDRYSERSSRHSTSSQHDAPTGGDREHRGSFSNGGPRRPTSLSISGIADDATTREVHVLFSGCEGYLQSYLAFEDGCHKKLYGVVQFDTTEHAQEAADMRYGTTWEGGAAPVTISLGRPEYLVMANTPQRSTRSPSPHRSGTPKWRGGSSSVPGDLRGQKVRVMRSRLAAAVERRKIPELEAAVAEAESAGLDMEDLAEARRVLNEQKRMVDVRKAASSEHRARAELWHVLSSMDDDVRVGHRIATMNRAIQAGEAAMNKCDAAGLQYGQQRLQKAVMRVSETWKETVGMNLRMAIEAGDVVALREILAKREIMNCDDRMPSEYEAIFDQAAHALAKLERQGIGVARRDGQDARGADSPHDQRGRQFVKSN
mmetsp:Transcript_73441/g.207409  ORF Transcript_73441/g.207409 Transcript_73441/m.207409 type:complete len:396 (-) Transcript_73441:169-1356(-)